MSDFEPVLEFLRVCGLRARTMADLNAIATAAPFERCMIAAKVAAGCVQRDPSLKAKFGELGVIERLKGAATSRRNQPDLVAVNKGARNAV